MPLLKSSKVLHHLDLVEDIDFSLLNAQLKLALTARFELMTIIISNIVRWYPALLPTI